LTGCEPKVEEDLLVGFWYATPKDAVKGDMTKAAFHFKENGSLLIFNGNTSISDWRKYSYNVVGSNLAIKDQLTQTPAQRTTIEINDYGTELTIDETCFLLKKGNYYKSGGGSYNTIPEPDKVETPTVDWDGEDMTYITDETVIVTLDTDTFGASIYYTLYPSDTTEDTDPVGNNGIHYILGTKIAINSKEAGIIKLRAVAIKAGLDDSDILTATYTFVSGKSSIDAPIVGANNENYTTAQTGNVTLFTTTQDAEIYYTLNYTVDYDIDPTKDIKDPKTDGIYYTPGSTIAIKSKAVGIITLVAITVKDGVTGCKHKSQYVFSTTKTAITVTSANDSGANTLREAVRNIASGGTITINNKVKEIDLKTRLIIDKSLTIEGNSVTITPSDEFPAEGSPLIVNGNTKYIGGKTVNIRRVHFKGGNNTSADTEKVNGGAIYNYTGGSLTVESCIFSLNNANRGGAIFNEDTASATVKGCTFYKNTATTSGGAIYHNIGTLILQGNLFHSNTATTSGPIVFDGGSTGTITSLGNNVTDVDFGDGTNQSGWVAVAGDKTFTELSVILSPPLFTNADEDDFSIALNDNNVGIKFITTRPLNFPDKDFNGKTREYPNGVPGAVNCAEPEPRD